MSGIMESKQARIDLLKGEVKFWFEESSMLASGGYIGEAADAYDVYMLLHKELESLLFAPPTSEGAYHYIGGC